MGQGEGVTVEAPTDRKPYTAPHVRNLSPVDAIRTLDKALARLARAEQRARMWKALAKSVWQSRAAWAGFGSEALKVKAERRRAAK